MVYAWCSHCLDFCRMALDPGFISCSSCGKVLGEVSVKTASNIKRNTKPRRIKRLTKKKTVFGWSRFFPFI
ncbi:hypothetical protein PTKIN_Ptkin11bG0073200 [Pterospermum kingtungense]